MLDRFILHNDCIVEASAPLLSAGQVGLLSGWGVFTTMRVAEGVPFAFERHWARLSRDAAALHVPMPAEPEPVRRRLLDLIEANRNPNCTLRLVILRNGGGMWEGPSAGRAIDVIALTAKSKVWGASASLEVVPHARYAANAFAGAKMISWAMNLTWLEAAQARGYDEALLLNERGEVAECTSANIFLAEGNDVWTPPLSAGCLPGITREVLLGETLVPGIHVRERTILPSHLDAADEVFITSTTRNLLPVRHIEGHAVRHNDRVWEALEHAFADYVKRYVAEHKRVPVSAK
ncbi:MAG TPA: aminotransferase class IV [Bryobacteraceae bacterium]|nr:aminotransferase class IV [Bryobacteraceae bacterium]